MANETAARLDIGDVLVDKYRITRLIGEGGMGIVYEAEHLSLGDRVAIKLLRFEHEPASPYANRLLSEARAAARIKSEYVARVHDFGTLPGGTPFLVMELVDGPSLSQVLQAHGPLSIDVAARHALEVCLALAEAHSLGIVHRDIKPSNLIVAQRRDGLDLIKVLDFGVAKQIGVDGPSMTASHQVLGSPSYMSPEQIRDAHTVDERTDVWSLGVVLYEMLTSRLPFESFTASGVLAAISADEPQPPTRHRTELDGAVESIVLRCLQKSLDRRFPRVVELAEALAPLTPGGPELAARARRLRETVHGQLPVAEQVEPERPREDETLRTQNATSTTAAESLAKPTPRRGRSGAGIALWAALGLATVVGVIAVIGSRRVTNAHGLSTPNTLAASALAASPTESETPAASAPVQPSATMSPSMQEDASVPDARSAARVYRTVSAQGAASALHPGATPTQPLTAPSAGGEPADFGYRK